MMGENNKYKASVEQPEREKPLNGKFRVRVLSEPKRRGECR